MNVSPDSPSCELQRGASKRTSMGCLVRYFLALGTVGFGGPVALAGKMHTDLVETRQWFTEEEYAEGMAFSQLAPGPLAAQLAIYLGWTCRGVTGATLVGILFVLPSFCMVVLLGALYVQFGGLPWIQGVFYGLGAAVIALVAQGAFKLSKKTLKKDLLLWGVASISAVVTAFTEKEFLGIFLVSGLVVSFVKSSPKFFSKDKVFSLLPAWILMGTSPFSNQNILFKLFVFFAKSGTVVFGSGLAIVPFLHGGVVNDHAWLTEQQFLDAVAVAMLTPGPVVITVAFIGFLVAGFAGACVAALGTFLPCYLFVVLCARHYSRFAHNQRVRAFVQGVTAAAVGALSGAAVVLGRKAVVDIPTALICVLAFLAVFKIQKIPDPILLLLAGTTGYFLKASF